ncbi:dUTP diphosphatase [Mycoplasma sp. CSL7503-lung]|uniref:dUTP diphosphatase n=1 Tax=Mycoplasma sp. CSL7503-lung TaxID=536372 RepID=UPI0021CE3ED8|nr:dUTP diphosphatase [Mycoplasma sp. CSL7503-lung]MCU4706920.1 dUTP diphosphatase [Mycoplasma sp. CSL7503-lung]
MNLEILFELQKKLDTKIHQKRKTTHPEFSDKNIKTQKMLALIIEAAEYVNEVQSFKYWKNNKNINIEAIKEEFADLMHFLITIGYEHNVNPNFEPKIINDDINEQFKELFISISNLISNPNSQNVIYVFEIALGSFTMQGFSYSELFWSYFKKNQKNYKRLYSNY